MVPKPHPFLVDGAYISSAASASFYFYIDFISEPLLNPAAKQLSFSMFQSGPLDSDCEQEGLIVCDGGRIQGEQGVSCSMQ